MGLSLSLIAISSGFVITALIFCIINTTLFHIPTIAVAVMMLVVGGVMFYICYKHQNKKYADAMQLWLEKGDFIFENYAISEIEKSIDSVYKSKLAINLCNLYSEKGEIDKAYDALRKANPMRNNKEFNNFYPLGRKFKMLYYNNIIHLNLLENDTVCAFVNYEDGKAYINEFVNTDAYSIGLLHTLSSLYLASGDTTKAMQLLKEAMSKCNDEITMKQLHKLRGKILAKMI